METLEIFVNKREAKGSAWLMAVITAGLYVGAAWLLIASVNDETSSDGPIALAISFSIFAWMLSMLTAWTLRLFRLSKFEGPLLVFTPNGIHDFWSNPKRELKWHDIRYTKWHQAGITANLQIIPHHQPFADKASSLFGFKKLDFPKQYFSEPDHIIAQFVLDHAPRDIIK